ncbi:N-terminal acetyltransferase B complex subunit arm1 [Golovinomyces cichoracearum]|uniref:N-terminal acetyltransferase B complex subunit arm1 n=1 Tax=Golovinomyces cichoracearum TaxID=62708 RepID=A0A420IPA1_9PEZI|nr:N-terminal acetyltransferase B complex subunit arm1 [Golovinomyces cichoracearum]
MRLNSFISDCILPKVMTVVWQHIHCNHANDVGADGSLVNYVIANYSCRLIDSQFEILFKTSCTPVFSAQHIFSYLFTHGNSQNHEDILIFCTLSTFFGSFVSLTDSIMDYLRDRQYTSVWNAVNAKNYKQAIKLIEKKLAKCPDDYLEALKIYVRGKSNLVSENLKILVQIEELACREPCLSNPDAIDLYDETITGILPDSLETWAKTIGELRWKSVKLSSKNEKLCLDALEACLSKNDLDHARKIVNVMEKNFQKNRNYIFWNVTIMVLFSLSDNYPDDEKKLWRNLAIAQINKLAASTKLSTGPGLYPAKSIQTPQEILLLHRILQLSETPEKSIEYLEDPYLGPESLAAKGNWELWRLRLKWLSRSKKWSLLFETSMSLLKRARTKDTTGNFSEAQYCDWIVWSSLLLSVVESNEQNYCNRARSEIIAHLNPDLGFDKSWKRNASLAYVKFQFENSVSFSDDSENSLCGSFSIKTIALLKYLYEYGHTSMAFIDLRPYFESLTTTEGTKLCNILAQKSKFIDHCNEREQNNELTPILEKLSSIDLSSSAEMTRAVNNLKLRYLSYCCVHEQKPYDSSSRDDDPLLNLVREAMKLYKTAIGSSEHVTGNLLVTDRHPVDDMAVLASMCLIKLGLRSENNKSDFLKSSKCSRIIQATVLLEYAWTYSRHNFQISLLLIRFYTFLGCGSLALRAYRRLGLKQIQLDTLSYTLVDRISTFHPHPYDQLIDGMTAKNSPVDHLTKQHKLYQKITGQISSNIWLSFQHGSYDSIFAMKGVSERLSRSLSAATCVIESRRITRLLVPSNDVNALPKKYVEMPLSGTFNLLDNNDYFTFPSFESNQGPNFTELCNFFPPPSLNRIRSSIFWEQMQYILSLRYESNGTKHMLGRKWLERYSNQVHTNTLDTTGMTSDEAVAHEICQLVALIAYLSCETPNLSKDEYEKSLHTYNTKLIEAFEKQRSLVAQLEFVIPASQSTLHTLYMAYEVGKLMITFNTYVESFESSANETQLEINKKFMHSVSYLIDDVVSAAQSIKAGLQKGGWLDQVLGNIDDELKTLVTEDFMEEWAGLVVESWRECASGLDYLVVPSI